MKVRKEGYKKFIRTLAIVTIFFVVYSVFGIQYLQGWSPYLVRNKGFPLTVGKLKPRVISGQAQYVLAIKWATHISKQVNAPSFQREKNTRQ